VLVSFFLFVGVDALLTSDIEATLNKDFKGLFDGLSKHAELNLRSGVFPALNGEFMFLPDLKGELIILNGELIFCS